MSILPKSLFLLSNANGKFHLARNSAEKRTKRWLLRRRRKTPANEFGQNSREPSWVRWLVIPNARGSFFLQNVIQTGDYLDGGGEIEHVRPEAIRDEDPDRFSWKSVPFGQNSYLIQNVKTQGCLDGGEKNMRPHSVGTSNWLH